MTETNELAKAHGEDLLTILPFGAGLGFSGR